MLTEIRRDRELTAAEAKIEKEALVSELEKVSDAAEVEGEGEAAR